MRKVSIVLFNLGGPKSLEFVRPFLFNLFYDKKILPMINPFRWLLANFVSRVRERKSKEIYKKIGGRSPILEQTEVQAKALLEKLKDKYNLQVLVAMRYSSPHSFEIMKQIELHEPEEIVLLPLYPHFSNVTSQSSIDDFTKNLTPSLARVKRRVICCYPTEKNFIQAHQNILRSFLEKNTLQGLKLLISAHGLPQRNIDQGDPYVWQIEASSHEIVKDFPGLDWQITYQSRVGPVEWTKPNTMDAIKEAALSKKDILILPISFVSEHSETLVELDIEYKDLAKSLGVNFSRLPTLQVENSFLESLSSLCEKVLSKEQTNFVEIYSQNNYRICPETYCKCMKNVN